MLAQALIAPIGACIVLRGRNLFCVVIILMLLVLHMILSSTNPDDNTALRIESEMAMYTSMGCLLASLVFYFLGFAGCFNDSMLRSDSWRTQQEDQNCSTKSTCPFTGEEAEMQCPCCLTLIHSSAFYEEGDLLKGFVIGEGPCLWGKAQRALLRSQSDPPLSIEFCLRKDSPAIGRLLLDEAMQIRSHFLLGGVGDACIGCITYLKALHILPKLSIVLICLGSFSGTLPYAFHQLLMELNQHHHSRLLQYILSFYSVFSSLSGVLIILQSFQLVLEFRTKHPNHSMELPWFWNYLEKRLNSQRT